MSSPELDRAAQLLGRARARIEQLEQAARAPIAIIGYGLRLPGGIDDTSGMWAARLDGRPRTGPVPPDRALLLGESEPGGFIDTSSFDAELFGIRGPDAAVMDPQQRWLLEACWQAAERASLSGADLRESPTATIFGICNVDNFHRLARADGALVDAALGFGNAAAMAAGRVAYALGLRGPAWSMDAACASSLLAIHLGVQALRAGTCARVFAGGANAVLTPPPTAVFRRMGVLSRSGRCRSFDAAADGYLRADGCGVVVMERLSTALAAGRPILAVIRGSAANHNGTGFGLGAPSPGAEEQVIRAALVDAGVTPAEVGYVEAFGVGTPLGDLAELTAMERVFGEGAGRRLPIGTVRPVFGHGEAAAGATSLIAAMDVLRRGMRPPMPGLSPSPRLPWTTCVASEAPLPWEGRRIVGVSAFSFSGTNAHIVLEAAPPQPAVADGPAVLPLSARSEAALSAWAGELARALTADPLPPTAVAATLRRRDLQEIRLDLAALGAADLVSALTRVAAGERPAAPAAPTLEEKLASCLLPPRPLLRTRLPVVGASSPRQNLAPLSQSLPDRELLAAAPEGLRRRKIEEALARSVARLLGRPVPVEADLAEAGLDSLGAVDLLSDVQSAWGHAIFPSELYQARSLRGLAARIAENMGEEGAASADPAGTGGTSSLAPAVRRAPFDPVTDHPADPTLPPPIFLLGAPRSGTTLLRAMLAANPALFAPPELHLLPFRDAAAWREVLAPDLLHLGVHQALLALGLSEAEVLALVDGWVANKAPIPAIYDEIRRRAAPRILVDKSPSYALAPEILARASRLFPGARFLRLIRHPIPVVSSFVARRMGRLLGDPPGSPWLTAETAWRECNSNLARFLPPETSFTVRYEELVADPEPVLRSVCAWLEIPWSPAMTAPHTAPRMPGEERGLIGDPGFYQRQRVEPELADAWRTTPISHRFGASTRALATELGYALPADPALLTAARLPDAVRPPDTARRPSHDLPWLMTGATGLLGPWLARALLARGKRVLAVVRAPDDAAARARVVSALGSDPGDALLARAGALDLPRFGWSEAEFRETGARISAVLHNGADVNFTRTWEQLASANIGGTHTALALACLANAPFHHVSTKGVFDPVAYPAEGPIPEDERPRPPQSEVAGYQATKWAAEASVWEASARGLSVSVYRPGRIGGDRLSGRLPDHDLLAVLLRACIAVGAVPDLHFTVELTPVDVLAHALVRLALEEKAGGAWHLSHPAPILLRDTVAALDLGLETLPYLRWRSQVLAAPDPALAALGGIFGVEPPGRLDDRRLGHARAAAALDGMTDWPPVLDLLRQAIGALGT